MKTRKLVWPESLVVRMTITAIALLCPSLCLAQAQETPSLLYFGTATVKPDMLQEWEDLHKTEVIPALKKAGVPPWVDMWQTAIFGDTYAFVTVAPVPNFAVFDSPHPALKALGPEVFTRLVNKLRKCVVSSRSQAVRFREDLSIVTEMQEPPKIAVVTTVRVTPGRHSDFENLLKSDFLPALRKLDLKGYYVHQTIFGGSRYDWTFVALHDKFADFDAGPLLVRAMGEEGTAKFLQKVTGIVQSVDFVVVRYRAELSFREEQ